MVQLRNVNTTDIGGAIRLGCQAGPPDRRAREARRTARNGVKDKIHAHP